MRWASARAATVVTALLVASGGLVVQSPAASAAPAAVLAAGCPSVSGGGSSPTAVRVLKSPKAAVHTGPAAKCAVYDYAPYGTVVYKWCSWFNASTGNWWSYTNWGWIYEGYLDGNLEEPC
ncbi:hypothetical protein ACFO1B_09815 [Dactylosporangium siamense]|uniref:SH3 domain-containing protein n=1 Tax=Dactylosporangium siamense TaxID=685454 RepID=A0A919PRT9_9ACTN|nr:hypothetical protein [Dactylosporangium siamense]GIG48989.1 hypothetical protein Dsi01nite_070300 [Dactylosporangium siamense]